ncbi:MAG: hemolysin III family protein [Syntrophomonadaceae bacterium]|nr:hemolysin III family protein [Syntrophomonadaceae bacterium]
MKEPINTWTHFIPFIAGIVGLVFLIIESLGNLALLVTMSIFGVSIILLYGASTVYHWVKTTPKKELLLRTLDHIAIYLLIAGTYTPILYFALDGAWKITMLVAVWLLALIGIIMKMFFINLPRSVSTSFYIALGWLAIIPFGKLIKTLPITAIILLILGGIVYTIGGIIYATKKLNFFPKTIGFHGVFHIFISLGTLIHFFMIYIFIIPLSI